MQTLRHIIGLTRSARYAIQAAVCMAECGQEFYKLGELAKCCGVPQPYLAKLLVKLRDADIVVSKRGQDGGYALAHTPEGTNLMRIVEAVMLESPRSRFPLPHPLAERFERLEELAREALEGLTVKDLRKGEMFGATGSCVIDAVRQMEPVQTQPNPTRRST